MRCAPRTQIPRISCYTKLLTVVKGFSKDLVSVRTPQAIRSKKIVIRSNGSGYPFEKEMSSNDSGYPFEKTCYPSERLGLSVWKETQSIPSKVFERHRLIRLRRIVIRSNGSAIRWKKNAIHPFEGLLTTQANPFEENCHPIEQLGLSVGKKCHLFELLGLSVGRKL